MDKTASQIFYDKLTSGQSDLVKQANDSINEFTRVKMREDGFARKVLPPIPIGAEEIDRSVDTDKPVKIVDKEPGSRAAVTVPFATTPSARYIKGPRYRVMFSRIMTPRFVKDRNELLTYHMDIRQVISDNAIKDMLAEEDGKFLGACTNAVGGSAGATVTETGGIHWRATTGEITRESLAESFKVMPTLTNSLEVATVLTNHITVKDIQKFRRDETGGDLAQEMFLKGFTETEIMGKRVIVTIKKDLVATSTMWHFAEPKFLGKFFILDDATMYMENRAFMIEFFAYSCIGGAIGNVAGVCRYDFNAGADA